MQPTQEQWLPVVGYEGLYEVSDLGRVRSLDRLVRGPKTLRVQAGRDLSLSVGRKGYPEVSLHNDGVQVTVRVHVLVAQAFIGPRPAGLHVCHNDGDGTNNRVANLRYDTPSENLYDRVRHGTHHWAAKTHCKQGHEFTPENTAGSSAHRICRICSAAAKRRYALKKKIGAPPVKTT